MSLRNQNWITFGGDPITGRTPTQMRIFSDPPGSVLTAEQQGFVAHAYKLFCNAVGVSAFPDGYHVQNRRAPDGTKVRMESNAGVHRVFVELKDSRKSDDPLHGIGIVMVNLDGTPIPDYSYLDTSNILLPQPLVLKPGRRGQGENTVSDGSWKVIRVPKLLGGNVLWVSRDRKDWYSTLQNRNYAFPHKAFEFAPTAWNGRYDPAWLLGTSGRIDGSPTTGIWPGTQYVFRQNDTVRLTSFVAATQVGEVKAGDKTYLMACWPAQSMHRFYFGTGGPVKRLNEKVTLQPNDRFQYRDSAAPVTPSSERTAFLSPNRDMVVTQGSETFTDEQEYARYRFAPPVIALDGTPDFTGTVSRELVTFGAPPEATGGGQTTTTAEEVAYPIIVNAPPASGISCADGFSVVEVGGLTAPLGSSTANRITTTTRTGTHTYQTTQWRDFGGLRFGVFFDKLGNEVIERRQLVEAFSAEFTSVRRTVEPSPVALNARSAQEGYSLDATYTYTFSEKATAGSRELEYFSVRQEYTLSGSSMMPHPPGHSGPLWVHKIDGHETYVKRRGLYFDYETDTAVVLEFSHTASVADSVAGPSVGQLSLKVYRSGEAIYNEPLTTYTPTVVIPVIDDGEPSYSGTNGPPGPSIAVTTNTSSTSTTLGPPEPYVVAERGPGGCLTGGTELRYVEGNVFDNYVRTTTTEYAFEARPAIKPKRHFYSVVPALMADGADPDFQVGCAWGRDPVTLSLVVNVICKDDIFSHDSTNRWSRLFVIEHDQVRLLQDVIPNVPENAVIDLTKDLVSLVSI